MISIAGKDWDTKTVFVLGPGKTFIKVEDSFAGISEGLLSPPPPYIDTSAFAEDALEVISACKGTSRERYAQAAQTMLTESDDPSTDPSCSVAFVAEEKSKLAVSCVGTCFAIVKTEDGSYNLVDDPRSKPWDRAVARALQVDISQGLGYPNALERVTKLIREHAKKSQRKNGPWYFSSNPDVAFEAVRKSFPAKKVDKVLIVNQGLGQVEDIFSSLTGIRSSKDLMEAAEQDLDSLAKSLRSVQNRDPETSMFARTEPVPDLAAIMLSSQ